jgi:hypothetical protein
MKGYIFAYFYAINHIYFLQEDMDMSNKFFASVQFLLGVLAVIIVIITYAKFGPMLKESISNSSVNDSEVLREVLDASIIASERWINLSSSSGECTSESTLQVFEAMRNELPKINDIINSLELISSSVEKNMPLKIPSVEGYTKTIKLSIPSIESSTQVIEIPYYKVDEKEEKVTYLKEILPKMEKKNITVSLCNDTHLKGGDSKKVSPPNHSGCTNEQIEYVSKIDFKTGAYSWKNPVVTQSLKKVSIQTPKISLKEQPFDIQEVKVVSQEIMGDVKEQLQLLSQQLRAVNTFPSVAENWIHLLQQELEQCPTEEEKEIVLSLKKNLINARDKITLGQGSSEELFKAAAGVVPCLLLILGLLAAATAVSGAAKLFGGRKKDKDCNENDTTTKQPPTAQQTINEQKTPAAQQN